MLLIIKRVISMVLGFLEKIPNSISIIQKMLKSIGNYSEHFHIKHLSDFMITSTGCCMIKKSIDFRMMFEVDG